MTGTRCGYPMTQDGMSTKSAAAMVNARSSSRPNSAGSRFAIPGAPAQRPDRHAVPGRTTGADCAAG